MVKRIIILLLCFFSLQRLCAGAEDKVIAIVNRDVITQSEADGYFAMIALELGQKFQGKELEERISAEKKELISKMIEDRVIVQEAKRQGMRARIESIRGKIDEIMKGFLNDSDFERSLSEKGLTSADLEKRIGEQIIMREIIEREVKSKIRVGPDEVTSFYNAHKKEFLQPTAYVVESLYFDDESIADRLVQDERNGSDFKSLAERYKISYFNETLSMDQLLPEIGEKISLLKISETTQPLKTEKGFYIFKLLEVIPEKRRSLPEVHSTIYNYIFNERFNQKMAEWLDGLMEKSYIVIK